MRKRFLLASLFIAGCGSGSTSPTPDGGGGGLCVKTQTQFDQVCLTAPTVAAARTQCGDVTEFCDKTGITKPNLDCLAAAPKMRPAMPATVTLVGYIHPFSGGGTPSGITMKIYKAADLLVAGADPAKVTPVVPPVDVSFDPATANDPTTFRICDLNPTTGCIQVTPAACLNPVCNDGLSGRPDDKDYCITVAGKGTCVPYDTDKKTGRLRFEPRFSIPNVPTNTQLVIRTGETDGKTTNWAVMYTWNVFLATDDKACADANSTDCLNPDGTYQLNANLLAQQDYINIPTVAGLSSGIGPGNSAVAGEVHDCDDIRVGNVQVGVTPEGDRFTYFNGNPYDTKPDSSRITSGTDRLGLYSSLNIVPGPVIVEAAALVDGKVVPAGKLNAVLFPDSVGVLNINGGKPQQ